MSLQELHSQATKKATEKSFFSATISQIKETVPIPADFGQPLEVESPLTSHTDEQGPTRQPHHGLPLVAAVSLPSLPSLCLLLITNPSTLELNFRFCCSAQLFYGAWLAAKAPGWAASTHPRAFLTLACRPTNPLTR